MNYPGHFYGQCSEICGVNHGYMPISIYAVEFQDFIDYLNYIDEKNFYLRFLFIINSSFKNPDSFFSKDPFIMFFVVFGSLYFSKEGLLLYKLNITNDELFFFFFKFFLSHFFKSI